MSPSTPESNTPSDPLADQSAPEPADQSAVKDRKLTARAGWHWKANSGVVVWLLAVFLVTIIHRWLPVPNWLLVHLLFLGALTNAILVWSNHFADAVLRDSASKGGSAGQVVRLLLANAGIVLVVAGMMSDAMTLVLVGGIIVGAAVIWHGIVLAVRMRRALPSRFKPMVRYYLAAAAFLPLGIAAGVLLANQIHHDRLVIAHLSVNVLGWIGLTIIGTLVTLWPTMLRTKIVPGTEKAAAVALWALVLGVILCAAAALFATPMAALAGLATYLSGIIVLAIPFVKELRAKPPADYSTYSVLAGVLWLFVSLIWLGVIAATSQSWAEVGDSLLLVAGVLGGGFAVQVLLGALSYLLPVVTGGGPLAVRAANVEFNRGAAWRISLINSGILLFILPVPSLVAVLASIAVVVGLAAFFPLLVRALWAAHRIRKSPPPQPSLAERRATAAAVAAERSRPGRFAGPAAAGLVAMALVAATAVALDPTAVGAKVTAVDDGITATGNVTTIAVSAIEYAFVPNVIEVPAGNELIIELSNDGSMTHDLVLANGVKSGRVNAGESVTIEAGVIGTAMDGWCSIVGHRTLGMELDVVITGASAPSTSGDSGTSDSGGMHEMDHGGSGEPEATWQPGLPPGDGFVARDAAVPPASAETTHRMTLTVRDTDMEVAPGVRQNMWTYDLDGRTGMAPGPTLRGKVGDTFIITLVNDGDMGHSIDFHSGALAPDGPMRTIESGESLEYVFTATKSGIWLYHCSTMPMSLHIANGMYGAVIIDPPDLAPVDKEYVVVGAEQYFGAPGEIASESKLEAQSPDAMVFNGYPNQYDAAPLTAKVGDRVRIWVLAAGPNEPLAFHIVGGQFDTVFFEGAYQLRPGNPESGGSQTLGLATSQGGFVELEMPEAGNYPFVNHSMWSAEHGQHGILQVTE